MIKENIACVYDITIAEQMRNKFVMLQKPNYNHDLTENQAKYRHNSLKYQLANMKTLRNNTRMLHTGFLWVINSAHYMITSFVYFMNKVVGCWDTQNTQPNYQNTVGVQIMKLCFL